MSFAKARLIADAVLFEGYVLYPYRRSSTKNRFRWAFGVLAPQSWSEAGGCEAWWLEAQLLVRGAAPALEGRLRFLRAQRRRVEAIDRDGDEAFYPVEALEAGDRLVVPWDEGEVHEVPFSAGLEPLLREEKRPVRFALEGGNGLELLRDDSGRLVGRVLRERAPIRGQIRFAAETLSAGPEPLTRLRVRVENVTRWDRPEAAREEITRSSLLSTHLLLSVSGGEFLSLIDPPEWAREAAEQCKNVGTFPVLAGAEGTRDLMLSAPIILYDHAKVAPESPGDFFDATEIDELLALRTRTLSEREKREARATDPRAAAILDRVDSMPPELLERLHGAVRELEIERPAAAGAASGFSPGDRVRLRPGRRRTDAQDFLFEGCVATVEKVLEDIDGRTHLAVTLDDDPAAELNRWHGRFLYFTLDEVEPLEPDRDREAR